MSNASAASAVNVWSGTCYFTPLLGAYLADAYFGRFWIIVIFSTLYMGGLAGLTANTSSNSLGPFWACMYLIALGTGGIKPCVSTFGADQFDDSKPQEAALIPRFFNYFYLCINCGAVLAATVVVNVQTGVSWMWGFLIPAVSFAVALGIFLLGSRLYRRIPPGGSPLTRMARVLAGACAHLRAKVPGDETKLHEIEGPMSVVTGQAKLDRTQGFGCLEKACTVTKAPGVMDRWLTTLTEVEELKTVLRLIPIMLTLIVYNAVYSQITTLFVIQGSGMDTALGSLRVAAATVSVLDSLAVIIWVLLYDLVIGPFFKRIGRPISRLVRIGIGFCIAILAMVVAAVVEIERLKVVQNNNMQDIDPSSDGAPIVPMSVWWQIPQYFLIGASEVFAMIGSLELFYSQAPDAMRSTCSALQLIATGFGSYLSAALVSIVQSISTKNGAPGWVAANLNDGDAGSATGHHTRYLYLHRPLLPVQKR